VRAASSGGLGNNVQAKIRALQPDSGKAQEVNALAAPPDGTWVALEPRGAEADVAPDQISSNFREAAYRSYTNNEYEDRRDPVEEGARF